MADSASYKPRWGEPKWYEWHHQRCAKGWDHADQKGLCGMTEEHQRRQRARLVRIDEMIDLGATNKEMAQELRISVGRLCQLRRKIK